MICKLKILSLFILLSGYLCSQKPFKQEVWWSLWHPVAAIKVKKIHKQATLLYKHASLKFELDSFNNGGKLDAFRHTFFMAAFAQKIRVKKIRKLGIAHEKGNYHQFLKNKNENGELPDSLSNVMDLNNNELGFKIGNANKKISLDELKQLVIKEIKNGKAQIIQRKQTGAYIDCTGNIIDLKQYSNKWSIPKCLVSSNYMYKN